MYKKLLIVLVLASMFSLPTLNLHACEDCETDIDGNFVSALRSNSFNTHWTDDYLDENGYFDVDLFIQSIMIHDDEIVDIYVFPESQNFTIEIRNSADNSIPMVYVFYPDGSQAISFDEDLMHFVYDSLNEFGIDNFNLATYQVGEFSTIQQGEMISFSSSDCPVRPSWGHTMTRILMSSGGTSANDTYCPGTSREYVEVCVNCGGNASHIRVITRPMHTWQHGVHGTNCINCGWRR